MNETIKTYLNDIVTTENYSQLLKDLLQVAAGSDNDEIWEKTQSFCEAEITENISFIVRVAQQIAMDV